MSVIEKFMTKFRDIISPHQGYLALVNLNITNKIAQMATFASG